LFRHPAIIAHDVQRGTENGHMVEFLHDVRRDDARGWDLMAYRASETPMLPPVCNRPGVTSIGLRRFDHHSLFDPSYCRWGSRSPAGRIQASFSGTMRRKANGDV
jgi:hypothetical protein